MGWLPRQLVVLSLVEKTRKNRIALLFTTFTSILQSLNHFSKVSTTCCSFYVTNSGLESLTNIAVSSAKRAVVEAASCSSVGTSVVKIENRNGDRSEPWVTSALR
jgi:hypothetical protein